MEPLLGSAELARIARVDSLLAFDFDGTLAPIVDDPAQAALRPSTRRLLAQVAQLYPCAVISGRTETQVRELLAGVTVWYTVGNWSLDDPEIIEQRFGAVRCWLGPLRERLQHLAGVSIEDKGVSLAIHYRAAADGGQARDAIREAAALLERVRIVCGKQAIHLFPEGASDKASVLDRLQAQLGCEVALYVGDDGTDERAFAAGPSVIGVRVGASHESAARFYLRGQEEVDDLLELLVALRARKTLPPERRRR
ncbi:MAG TPA: trehalose-phosphatase [Myxococcales bacterium]|nr:trehalose-phosphatase [Myxococcales bacterium]